MGKIEARPRIQSLDIVRGLVMIIMAIDHVRDFFHYGAQRFDPMDLSQTTAVLYLTRWITHTHVSCVMKLRKPDAAFFAKALATAGVRAEESVFVDDREENCEAARKLGMRAVQFESAAELTSALKAMGLLSG